MERWLESARAQLRDYQARRMAIRYGRRRGEAGARPHLNRRLALARIVAAIWRSPGRGRYGPVPDVLRPYLRTDRIGAPPPRTGDRWLGRCRGSGGRPHGSAAPPPAARHPAGGATAGVVHPTARDVHTAARLHAPAAELAARSRSSAGARVRSRAPGPPARVHRRLAILSFGSSPCSSCSPPLPSARPSSTATSAAVRSAVRAVILLAIIVSIAYFPWFWWKGGQTRA